MPIKIKRALCWIRRDLRLHDHYALSEALKQAEETFIVFIFDKNILEKLVNYKKDPRITLITESLIEIDTKLKSLGSSLIVRHGDPITLIPKIIEEFNIDALFYNRDYEPYAKLRDQKITKTLIFNNIEVFNFKDHVQYEHTEILNGSGEIYKVFTPYKNKWLETFYHRDEGQLPNYKCNLKKLAKISKIQNELTSDELAPCILKGGSHEALKKLKAFSKIISNYKDARDIPALDGTSWLAPYIRLGNLSIRDMFALSLMTKDEGHQTWLSEIIWRDFYQMILDAHPEIENSCFKPQYNQVKWLGNKENFIKWCEGQTGFPIIDSAMRCLNSTGFMHNRLRMVVASFLTKTLLIDWREGEKYFAKKLLDYDMAANNGGWQWSASTGVDAQPYFRIFNPYSQSRKFDTKGKFIREWCPELKLFSDKEIHAPHDLDLDLQEKAKCIIGINYPLPIVAYTEQRKLALKMLNLTSH